MNTLPPEILHSIFTLLYLSDRLKCTLVCRSWWSILDRHSLFSSVDIWEEDNFVRFIDMIEQSPHRAAQVENLSIASCIPFNFNRRKLCNMFPNLKTINLARVFGDERFYLNFDEPITTTQSRSTVQAIDDFYYCEYTLQMITSNLCGRLEKLMLDFNYIDLNTDAIIPQLKNMPVLKSLNIMFLGFAISHLELLHHNLPSLQSLELFQSTLWPSDLPENIAPADSLKKLYLGIVEAPSPEGLAEWYQYVNQKYAKVPEINYEDDDITNLGFYGAETVYQNGFLDFLQMIGPTKSHLELDKVPDSVDVFKALDAVDCRMKQFRICNSQKNILQSLVQSNQSKYVETLSFFNTKTTPLHFKSLTALTTLYLYVGNLRGAAVNLTEYLNAFPATVNKLSIHTTTLEIDRLHIHPSSIEYLDISTKSITKDLGELISLAFPKLVDLKLKGAVVDDLNIQLHSTLLQKVQFITYDEMDSFFDWGFHDHCFSFQSPSHVEPQFYICDDESIKPGTYQDAQDLEDPILTIKSSIDMKLNVSRRSLIELTPVNSVVPC